MEIVEGELVEIHFEGQDLMEQIIDLANLRKAYRQVERNKGRGGVDGMDVKELFSWCQSHIEDLRRSLMDGTYVPNPVRHVEIPKDNGKKRLLGIPTVIDRMVQQAISQILSPIFEPKVSRTSYGFRPKRGAHDALREARKNVTEGYKVWQPYMAATANNARPRGGISLHIPYIRGMGRLPSILAGTTS